MAKSIFDGAPFQSSLDVWDNANVALFVDEAHLLIEFKGTQNALEARDAFVEWLQHHALANPVFLLTGTPKLQLLEVLRACRDESKSRKDQQEIFD